MKRKFVLTVMTMLMIASIMACGGTTEPEKNSREPREIEIEDSEKDLNDKIDNAKELQVEEDTDAETTDNVDETTISEEDFNRVFNSHIEHSLDNK